MRLKRTLPPSGAPLYLKDFLAGIYGVVRPAKTLKKFEDELRSYFGVKHVFLVSSGKAALTLILESLSEIAGRQEVVIPSYTCFSVPSAIVKGGLKPIICDIAEDDINYESHHLKEAVSKDTLCVLATHLFGIPCNMEPISTLAMAAESYVVEDCAQAMGAELNGKRVGTAGDVGFFSLGRGKNLSAVSGGIIITNDDDIAKVLAKKYEGLGMPGLIEQMGSLCVALFLDAFSRPSLYWFPASLPFLGIGKTVFSTDFSITKLAGFNAGLAANWKSKLETFNEARRKWAEIYANKLKDNGFVFVREPAGSSTPYLRFPLITGGPAVRENVCGKLSSAGLGASSNYPTGIAEIPELSLSEEQKVQCQMGSNLARRLLTLATHPQVKSSDIEKVIELVHNLSC